MGFPRFIFLYYLARPLQRSRGKAFDIFLHTMRHERYPFDFDFGFDLVIRNIRPKPHFSNSPQSQDLFLTKLSPENQDNVPDIRMVRR